MQKRPCSSNRFLRDCNLPVVAADIVKPTALFVELHRARAVLPGGVAVHPLVLLAHTLLHRRPVTAALGVGVVAVLHTFLRLRAPKDGTYRVWGVQGERESMSHLPF